LTFADFDGDRVSYIGGSSSFVAFSCIDNNMKEAVLKLSGEEGTVRLDACTFENNTVLQHNLWQEEQCVDSSRFYSDSSLDVWCEQTSTASKTQPLAALPADTGILTAEDPFLARLQQVCAELIPILHGAMKSLLLCPS
jgi:hypothetical protein